MTDHLGRLLLVRLEAARVNADLPVLGALRSWVDSCRGIGAVERGGYNPRAAALAAAFDAFYLEHRWAVRSLECP